MPSAFQADIFDTAGSSPVSRSKHINMKRKCVKCGVQIEECMGFVLARDIVNRRKIPREICGKCVLITEPEELGGLINGRQGKIRRKKF